MTPEALVQALRDRYRIERELGQGGMANVYLAQDLRHNRQVAVKVLRPELAVVIGADRFLSEIKTTAKAVPLTSGPALTLGSPRELFSVAGYRGARNRPEYDVAPDARHFLMIRDLPGRGVDVVYVENWFPELLAKVKR